MSTDRATRERIAELKQEIKGLEHDIAKAKKDTTWYQEKIDWLNSMIARAAECRAELALLQAGVEEVADAQRG